jgi:hypothetical protein
LEIEIGEQLHNFPLSPEPICLYLPKRGQWQYIGTICVWGKGQGMVNKAIDLSGMFFLRVERVEGDQRKEKAIHPYMYVLCIGTQGKKTESVINL